MPKKKEYSKERKTTDGVPKNSAFTQVETSKGDEREGQSYW